MTELKVRNGKLRGLKIFLFYLCLVLLAIVSLVLLIRAHVKDTVPTSEVNFSWGALLDGSYLQEKTGGLLDRDMAFDDQTPPVLTLTGEEIPVEVGGAYTEPGYTATDKSGKDLTDRVTAVIDGDFLCYSVTDQLGNSATAKRAITYVDTTPPEVTLTGGAEYHIPAGTEFEEPGYTAVDNSDGDVTDQVQVSGSVEKYKIGTYPITYTVSDALGNTATVERQVHVDPAEQPEVVDPDGKVIYLTFDDGPGPYTEQLLDILDQYGIKVTFFVTAQYEEYLDMIGEAHRRGHTIAIHTYHHDFEECYSSEDGYFEDLNKMQAIVEEQTGETTTLVRFPGGSSNTVSANYCTGIMSLLAEDLEAMGYQYFDWNVTSGDAGETTDTDTVVENVKSGVLSNGDDPSIVLQHDIKEFSVNAVEDIIVWGLENGYTFLPLSSSSPTVHHGINN